MQLCLGTLRSDQKHSGATVFRSIAFMSHSRHLRPAVFRAIARRFKTLRYNRVVLLPGQIQVLLEEEWFALFLSVPWLSGSFVFMSSPLSLSSSRFVFFIYLCTPALSL